MSDKQPHKYQVQIDAWTRDEKGFLPIEYHFKDDNSIDWRRMIPAKYLVPNKDRYPEGMDLKAIDVTKEEDGKLLILLSGLRKLAKIRGQYSVVKTLPTATQDFVSCLCEITFIGDHETNYCQGSYTGEADAHAYNTGGDFKHFLTSIAGNRAEARAIKNALGIEILAKEELPMAKIEKPQKKAGTGPAPLEMLKTIIAKSERDVQEIFDYAKNKGWGEITDINNFPTEHIYEMIGKLKKKI